MVTESSNLGAAPEQSAAGDAPRLDDSATRCSQRRPDATGEPCSRARGEEPPPPAAEEPSSPSSSSSSRGGRSRSRGRRNRKGPIDLAEDDEVRRPHLKKSFFALEGAVKGAPGAGIRCERVRTWLEDDALSDVEGGGQSTDDPPPVGAKNVQKPSEETGAALTADLDADLDRELLKQLGAAAFFGPSSDPVNTGVLTGSEEGDPVNNPDGAKPGLCVSDVFFEDAMEEEDGSLVFGEVGDHLRDDRPSSPTDTSESDRHDGGPSCLSDSDVSSEPDGGMDPCSGGISRFADGNEDGAFGEDGTMSFEDCEDSSCEESEEDCEEFVENIVPLSSPEDGAVEGAHAMKNVIDEKKRYPPSKFYTAVSEEAMARNKDPLNIDATRGTVDGRGNAFRYF